jgi:hypothetical protein
LIRTLNEHPFTEIIGVTRIETDFLGPREQIIEGEHVVSLVGFFWTTARMAVFRLKAASEFEEFPKAIPDLHRALAHVKQNQPGDISRRGDEGVPVVNMDAEPHPGIATPPPFIRGQ